MQQAGLSTSSLGAYMIFVVANFNNAHEIIIPDVTM